MYIGKTKYNIETRYKQHLQKANEDKILYPLYKAMRKYGIENFTVEEIEKIDNEEKLNEREKYWIEYYDTYIKHGKGYNCTLGGEGNSTIDENEVYELWDEGYGIQQISDILHNDRSAIRNVLKQYDDYIYVKENNIFHRKIPNVNEQDEVVNNCSRKGRGKDKKKRKVTYRYHHKRILQYDLKGNYLNKFLNMHDAERKTGVSAKNIHLAVNHKQKHAGNYQWRFEDDKDIPTDISQEIKIYKQKVKQIDKTNNKIINVFESAAEASRITGINSICIREVCHGDRITAGGFKWEYIKE